MLGALKPLVGSNPTLSAFATLKRGYGVIMFAVDARKRARLYAIIKKHYYKNMVKGNFLGAAIVAIIYTVYILINPLPKTQEIVALVILNALTIVLMSFAFK